jgi:acyl-CoA thioester hydrolase
MKQLKHTAQVRVRYAETDAMAVVYNGNYFTFFEVARVELMRNFNMVYADLEKEGCQLPLTETGAKYIKPAVYDDLLDIRAICTYNGGVRLEFNYEVYRGDELLTTGFTKHTFFNMHKKKPMKPPHSFIDAYNSALEE